MSKQITLVFKNEMPDDLYNDFCNKAEELGCFRGCGNTNNKWVKLEFEDEQDCCEKLISLEVK